MLLHDRGAAIAYSLQRTVTGWTIRKLIGRSPVRFLLSG